MKIILEAYGFLYSKPVSVPNQYGDTHRIPILRPMQVRDYGSIEKEPDPTMFLTFQFRGEYKPKTKIRVYSLQV